MERVMYLVSGYARTASAATPPPFINYSQIELVQVGAKDEEERRRDHGSAAFQYKCCADARHRGPHQRLYALPRSCLQSANEAARHPFP